MAKVDESWIGLTEDKQMGYFDNAATTPLMPEVKDYIIELLDLYGNPSSVQYDQGVQARNVIDNARESVANFISAEPEQITFCPSGSAANCLGIDGWIKNKRHRVEDYGILYSSVCHKSIKLCCEDNWGVPLLVDNEGMINERELIRGLSYMRDYHTKALVVLSYADSEIGTIQDIIYLTDLCHNYGADVMVDATGFIPSCPVDVLAIDCDILTFSGHKLGAPKGVGVLYKKYRIDLSPIVYGAQEQGLFGGTENIIGIGALGKACELYSYDMVNYKHISYLWEQIQEKIDDVYLIGRPINKRLPHNLYIRIKGIIGQQLITLVDQGGYQISAGSACNTGSLHPSPTLTAIGLTEREANECIRISLSGNETQEELDEFVAVLSASVKTLRWVTE